jgi:DNA-binding transcriptional ArsR family regulator
MRKKMLETQYRASRVCRILGNPTAYQIMRLLLDSKLQPSAIARKMGISLSLVSNTLRNLRNLDILRYETKGKEKRYWIKDPKILDICTALEEFVSTMRTKKY